MKIDSVFIGKKNCMIVLKNWNSIVIRGKTKMSEKWYEYQV